MNLSVIIPTYNERENINELTKKICHVLNGGGRDFEIIVVDDNSPDGTAQMVRNEFIDDEKVRLIERFNERGLATAIKTGIIASKGDMIVLMDADFSHDPVLLPRMLTNLDNFDIVSGSRFVPGGKIVATWWGPFLSRMINRYLRLILRLKTKDNTNGFLAFKKEIVMRHLDKIFYGYGDFHFRLFYYAKREDRKVLEIPCAYYWRKEGESKTRVIKYGWGYLYSALKLSLRIDE